jgi:hypothetical protein
MGFRKDTRCIMADLGKVEDVLKKLETLPECKGCTTLVRSGRRTVRRIMKSMNRRKGFKVNWGLVEQVIQIISRLMSLINLERLKGYFNICKKHVGILYERCRKTWQTDENDSIFIRGQAKRCCLGVGNSRPVVIDV